MITRIHGKIVVECDGCGETLETETAEFVEAREQMREEGWRARKFGADWSHYCAVCSDNQERGKMRAS